MNGVEAICIDRATGALEVAIKERHVKTTDLGSIILHTFPGGFLAFFADGSCYVGGEAVEWLE